MSDNSSPRRRPRKSKAAQPEVIRDPYQRHLEAIYATRMVQWHQQLRILEQPDWELLLDLHLQLCELERLQETA
jgi:hypothetical protein